MKKVTAFILFIILICIFHTQSVSANGLVYETKAMNNNKIKVTLKWSSQVEAKGFIISYFYIENGKTLHVGYELKAKAPKTATLDFDLKTCIPPINVIISKAGDLSWRPFKDIKGIEAEKYIWHLHDAGILPGGSADKFRPNDLITRAEFSEILCKAIKLAGSSNNIKAIKDIDKIKEKGFILAAVNKGLLNIYKDKTFKPKSPLSVAEVCMSITKAFNFTTSKNGIYLKLKADKAYSASVKKIFNLNILNVKDKLYVKFNEESSITRANCAMMISRALLL